MTPWKTMALPKSPFMLLYHMNFGYPLVDEGTVLETNLPAPRPRDADAEAGLETYKTFEAPQPVTASRCSIISLKKHLTQVFIIKT